MFRVPGSGGLKECLLFELPKLGWYLEDSFPRKNRSVGDCFHLVVILVILFILQGYNPQKY